MGQTAPVKQGDLASGRDKGFAATDRYTAPQLKEVYKEAEVWVKKWVDYSSKYGLGYYLSNDATGVFSNDSTKIVLDPNGYHLEYMERRA